MGMSASQARLLCLTAKKSDLELQAQKINNDRTALSRQEETLMSEYTDKISNKELKVRNKDGEYQEFTLENLLSSNCAGTYAIKIDGVVYTNSTTNIKTKDSSGKEVENPEKTLQSVADITDAKNKIKDASTTNLNAIGGTYNCNTGDEVNNATVRSIIEGCGNVTIYKYDETAKQWKEVNYAADSTIKEQYYDKDDAEAKAIYDSEMRKIQTKDKSLELQLNDIETEHKAIETEISSVEQIINKNIEGSYKTFGQG